MDSGQGTKGKLLNKKGTESYKQKNLFKRKKILGGINLKKYFFILIAATILIFAFVNLNTKKIFVIAEVDGKEKIITSVEARKKIPLVINFIHSVQKTPVIEELEFDGENFILLRTKYKSHGVGLPFLESDGNFREENGIFIMDNMNRTIKNLELRTGVGTQLTIFLDGKEFKLHENFPAGTKIKFEIR